ncbi:hypothetical protein HAX54_009547 [Datura stramonium]|uniref:dCMP deaminase n=1 Tax=Datura stramonium TaxID=4076 RepID=A0ABS8RWH3_DATST|nr:hypothetical protein [Datura stramonium]
MNSKELTLVSAAAVIGALASAMTIRCSSIRKDSGINGFHRRKTSSRNPFDPSKRQGYLSWDDYFMAIAFLSAERSKDPNRQAGACLALDTMGSHVAVRMTSFPGQRNSKNGNPLETKYPYVCHAEVNAILNTNHASAAGTVLSHKIHLTPIMQRLYVTMFPCNECAKIIIQSGVSEVIYFVEKRLDGS